MTRTKYAHVRRNPVCGQTRWPGKWNTKECQRMYLKICLVIWSLYCQLLRDGPLENLWGRGGEVQKKSRKGKLNEKNSCTPINPKKYSCYGLKEIHTRNLIAKKNSCGSKIPTPSHNFSNGRSLIWIVWLNRWLGWTYVPTKNNIICRPGPSCWKGGSLSSGQRIWFPQY